MSMAAEMAQSAVQNGRWHHTAACRALEEYLVKKKQVIKGKSYTTKLNSFQDSHSNFSNEDFPLTASMPSSIDDTISYDVGTFLIDEEECEEWAAAVVGRAELEKYSSIKPLWRPSRQRALSITSPESSSQSNPSTKLKSFPPLSCSPVGFWHVPPGEGKEENDINEPKWSIQTSPRQDSKITRIMMKRSQSYSQVSTNTLSPSISYNGNKLLNTCSSIREESHLYRAYYLKFINLLITREIHIKYVNL